MAFTSTMGDKNNMTRQFAITPGHRDERMPLFIGLVGPSGSGKTRSAMRLAVGMQSVTGGEIVFINTEGRRGTMDLDNFKKPDGSPAIHHMPFEAPFASLDYLDAILEAQKFGARTIVIDSMSHEHEQEGGMLDFQEQELNRMAGDDWKKREAMKMLAWAKPKAARRRLLTRGIMQADMNIIACFRAKETSRPVRKEGKTVVEALGFTPIAGDEFVFECALSAFLPPNCKGVPEWYPDGMGERMAVKRPDHLEGIVRDGEQLSEEMGARLAKWASGKVVASASPVDPIDAYAKQLGRNLKEMTWQELSDWWSETEPQREGFPRDRLDRMNAAVAKKIEEA